jgi:hypothetical protein
MDVFPLLVDLFGHMAWADSRIWAAFDIIPEAAQNAVILNGLAHIHLIQKVFLTVWQGETVIPKATEQLEGPALKEFACRTHGELATYLAGVGPEGLGVQVTRACQFFCVRAGFINESYLLRWPGCQMLPGTE